MSAPRAGSLALVIARTDLRQLRQSRDFWLPLLVVAIFMFAVVPAALLLTLTSIEDPTLLDKLGDLAGSLPDGTRATILAANPELEAPYSIATYLLPPLVTLVPLTVTSAVAANTFVGERERGSGEFLANSPATARDIFLGKLIATLVPAGITALAGLAVYTMIVNLVLTTRADGLLFPTGNWWLICFWVEPPVLVLAAAVILMISSRVSSGAAAQQAASLIALPLVAVVYTVASASLFDSPWAAGVAGALAWVAAIVAVRVGSTTLRRDRLLGVT